jgi:hypothetical protein
MMIIVGSVDGRDLIGSSFSWRGEIIPIPTLKSTTQTKRKEVLERKGNADFNPLRPL